MVQGEGILYVVKEYAGYVLAGFATVYYMMVWAKRKIMDDLFATKKELSEHKVDVHKSIKLVMENHENVEAKRFADLDKKMETRHMQLVDIVTRHVGK